MQFSHTHCCRLADIGILILIEGEVRIGREEGGKKRGKEGEGRFTQSESECLVLRHLQVVMSGTP